MPVIDIHPKSDFRVEGLGLPENVRHFAAGERFGASALTAVLTALCLVIAVRR